MPELATAPQPTLPERDPAAKWGMGKLLGLVGRGSEQGALERLLAGGFHVPLCLVRGYESSASGLRVT